MTTPQQIQVNQPVMVTPISLDDVYKEQLKMGIQLAVITEQLKDVPDHEVRIRALERFRFSLLGVAVTASVVASAGASWVGYVIGHH